MVENNNEGLGPQIFISRSFFRPSMVGVDLYFANTYRDGNGVVKVQEFSGEYKHPLSQNRVKVIDKIIPECDSMRPLVTLSEGQAQRLMDGLWRAGIRPAEGRGTIATAQAMEKHLNDMRVIVEKKLDVKLRESVKL